MEDFGPIVEFEGWLLKRGAGYNMEDAQADLVDKFRGGKGEKKRYFVLVREKSKKDSETASLNWYASKPEGKKKKPQGGLTLERSFTVKIVDNSILEIHTPARIYYLRPTVEATTAEARTVSSQWKAAIEYAMSRVTDSSSSKSATNPLNFNRRQTERVQNGSQFSLVESGVEGTSFVNDGEIDSDKSYYSLWKINGIDGYNALMAHFGPVQTDLQRLHRHVEARIAQLSEVCNMLEKNRIQASEPILTVQKTTKDALKALYTENRQRLDMYAGVVVQISQDVLKPLEQLTADIKEELENVVRFYGKYTQKLERTRKAVMQSAKEVQELEGKFAEAQKVAQVIGNGHGLSATDSGKKSGRKQTIKKSKSMKDLKKKPSFMTRKVSFKLPLRNKDNKEAVDNTTLQEYADSLAEARKNRQDLEVEYDSIEKKIGKNMKAAMDKLEKLERDMMAKIKAVLLKLADYEVALFGQMVEKLEAGGDIESQISNVNPETDMKLTTDFLLQEAKRRQKTDKK